MASTVEDVIRITTRDTADEVQSLVASGFQAEDKVSIRRPGWVESLAQIAATPDEKLKTVLGVTGERMKSFALKVNLDHPDLELVLSEAGNVAGFFADACSLLVISEPAEQTFLQKEGYGKIARFLQSPRPRLLQSADARQAAREIKKQVKSVGLKSVFTGGENSFYGRPAHFKRFARGSKFYQTEIADLNVRASAFQQHGMPELANTFQKRMRDIEEGVADICGFYRLKPDEAAVTLARLHGFRWNDTGSVVVPSKCFDDKSFWTDGSTEYVEDPMAEALKKTMILNTKFVPTGAMTINFTYQPRLYPLANFGVEIPAKAKEIIANSEALGALGGTPFFDYFWVLVPGINVVHPAIQKPKDCWTIRDGEANNVFSTADDAATFLDTMLVRDKYLIPIIIGERDGKCYFLSMWN